MIHKNIVCCCLISIFALLGACNRTQVVISEMLPTYEEEKYTDLVFDELDQEVLTDPGIPVCKLTDLSPFGWKEVDVGLVDIRTPQEYPRKTESLYQE